MGFNRPYQDSLKITKPKQSHFKWVDFVLMLTAISVVSTGVSAVVFLAFFVIGTTQTKMPPL